MSMETSHESIAPFDREYTLKDLLPPEVVRTWVREAPQMGVAYLSVVLPDGRALLPENQEGAVDRIIEQHLSHHHPAAKSSCTTSQGGVTLLPLIHELEPVGYLVLGFHTEEEKTTGFIEAIGAVLGTAIAQIMKNGYGLAMASQVHGEMVEDSYEVLKQKAFQLAKSEKKYRILATNLNNEVKRKAEEIRQTQECLMHQEKMASIGQLAAGVAHEINNPMGFIASNLNSLNEYFHDLTRFITLQKALIQPLESNSPHLDTQVQQSLQALHEYDESADIAFVLKDIPQLICESIDGAERIQKIVQDLKDFAHPGEEESSLADVDANLEKSINIVGSELKYKVTLKKNYGKPPPVQCYPRQLDQVFINLLINAAHAIPDKGTVTVTTGHDDTHVIVAISDTGSGIPKDRLKRIFDPFYTTKPVGKGTGLGLNMVYNIVKRHKGSIGVKSEVNKGTTFTLRLPRHRLTVAKENQP